MREGAERVLVEIGRPAVAPLIAALAEQAWTARTWTIAALAQIDEERTIEPLLAALSDESDDVRTLTVWALGHKDADPVTEPLIAALMDPEARVREVASRALQQLSPRSIPALIAALETQQERPNHCASTGRVGGLFSLGIERRQRPR